MMRIKCEQCGAIYNVSDEKIRGRTDVKIKCRKCGNLVSIAAQVEESSYSSSGSGDYYLALSGQREGPFTANEVIGMIKRGVVDGRTFYWKKGLSGWAELKDAVEFKELGRPREDEPPKTEDAEKTVVTKAPFLPEKEESTEKRVWERKETSVLFSIDSANLKRGDRRTVEKEDAVIDLSSISPNIPDKEMHSRQAIEPLRRKVDVKDTIISLEGVDLTQTSKALSLKKRRRNRLIFSAAASVTVLGIACAIFLIYRPEPLETPPVHEKKLEDVQKSVIEHKSVIEPKIVKKEEPPPETKVAANIDPAQQQMPANVRTDEEVKTGQIVALKDKEKRAKEPKKKQKESKDAGSLLTVSEAKVITTKKEEKDELKKETVPVDANKLLQDLNLGIKGDSQKEGGEGQQKGLPSKLSITQIHSIARKSAGKISECVRTAGVKLTQPMRINTTFTIQPSGRVESARVTSGNVGAAEGCIISVLKSMNFPQFSGEKMTVPYPFTVTQ